jgi:hypothetical protein
MLKLNKILQVVVALKKENELLREEVCQDHFEMNAFLA